MNFIEITYYSLHLVPKTFPVRYVIRNFVNSETPIMGLDILLPDAVVIAQKILFLIAQLVLGC